MNKGNTLVLATVDSTVQVDRREILRLDGSGRNSELIEVRKIPSLETGKGVHRSYLRPEGRLFGKKRMNDRYIAGLFDADASFSVSVNGCTDKMQARVSFSSVSLDLVRWAVHSLTPPTAPFLWGTINTKKSSEKYPVYEWQVAGKRAVACAERLMKFLVANKERAKYMVATHDVPAGDSVKFVEVMPAMPKHPCRPWVAGYIDGDGSINASICEEGYIRIRLTFSGEGRKETALRLLHKQYGGSLYKKGGGLGLEITLSPSKAVSLFDKNGIAKHLVHKRSQGYLALGCAALRKYNEYPYIYDAFKFLNNHPHRLSGMDSGEVANLLLQIETRSKRQSDAA